MHPATAAVRSPALAAGGPARARIAAVLPAGSLRRRLASGAAWSVLGSGLSQGLALPAAALAARSLGTAGYGSLAVALATSTLLSEVAGAGVAVAATRHVAELRAGEPGRAGRLAGSALTLAAAGGLLLAALQAVLAPWIAGTLLGTPAIAPLLRMAAPLTLVAAVATAQAGVLTGFEAFRGQAVGGAIRGVVTLLAVIPGAMLLGASGAIAGYALAAAAGALVLARSIGAECAARGMRLRFVPSGADLRELARLGVPAVAASLLLTLAAWASTALLARSSISEAGVLGVARQWQAAVLFLAGAVSGLGLPVVASALPARNAGALRRALAASFAATTGLALLAAIPVALLAPTLLGLSGPAFAARPGVLVVSCATAVLLAANMVVGQAIWALSAPRAGVAFALLRALLLVLLSALLAPRGAMGVALAWLVTGAVLTLVQAPWMAWLVRRRVAGWSGR